MKEIREESIEKSAEIYVNQYTHGIAHPRRVCKNAFKNGFKAAVELLKTSWVPVSTPPSHKELVLVDCGIGIALPAIYYSNRSFNGFYKFTAQYHVENTVYSNVPLSSKKQIHGAIKWLPLPETQIQINRS